MMNYMADAALLAKRQIDASFGDNNPQNPGNGQPGNLELPTWTLWMFFLDFLVFFPVLVVLSYTLNQLYLTLAMIEDPNPPAYEPLGTDDTESATTLTGDGPAPEPAKPITSSLRATNKLLRSIGGWKSNFRGFACHLVLAGLTGIAQLFFSAFTFAWIGSLLASLVLVQFHTAWVTIIISQPSPKPFWRRLPAFRKTFEATCFPVLAVWLAQTVSVGVPTLIAAALGLNTWDPKRPNEVPDYNGNTLWKGLIVMVVAIVLTTFLIIPAHVVLRRVQASLLPLDEDPIVPFDRSFEGTVEPAIVGGKGYVSMANAFKTFNRASWLRLVKVYLKIFGVTVGVYAIVMAVMIGQFIAVAANSSIKNGN